MSTLAIFLLQLGMSLLVWGLVFAWVVNSRLKRLCARDALFWLTLRHAFRHV